ncbi:MAG: hypothetical protein IT455_17980 [Planctomycetes bacterium]|nr:hypothetical protein [Planctomycetota bacterium]
MSRPWSLVFVIAGCLGIPAVIGASCYVTIEVLHLRGPAQHLAIGGMLLLGLGPPLRWFAARSVPAQAAARRRHHERRIRQRVDELRGDPARERWIPLVEAGFPVDDQRLSSWNARIAELESVPHRRRHVGELLRGRPLTDEQIDYLEFPARLATCEHLRPVEAALRAADHRVSLRRERAVHAPVRLGFERLRTRFALPACVEAIDVEHNWHDAVFDHRLCCTTCHSEIVGEADGEPWPA